MAYFTPAMPFSETMRLEACASCNCKSVGLLVLAALNQLVKLDAFFRKRGGQGQNGSAGAHGQGRINNRRAAGEDLESGGRAGDNFANALHAAGAVLDADNIRMLRRASTISGVSRVMPVKMRNGIEQDGIGEASATAR